MDLVAPGPFLTHCRADSRGRVLWDVDREAAPPLGLQPRRGNGCLLSSVSKSLALAFLVGSLRKHLLYHRGGNQFPEGMLTEADAVGLGVLRNGKIISISR